MTGTVRTETGSCSVLLHILFISPQQTMVTQNHRTRQLAKAVMPIVFHRVTLLTPHCPEGFQLSVVDFQQCLEGCWDHRRLFEQSCLTLHQLELSQSWDKKRSFPSFPLPCFISAPGRTKVEAHLPGLKIHVQQLFLFQLCWILVHFQWPSGPVICGARLIQLHANHQAHASW